jgi:biotin carboxylase
MKKKLMILGAGVYQVPLIKMGIDMGLEVITVSPMGDYPGIHLAHRNLPIDTTDIEKVLRGAQELSIDAITTTGTDVAVPAIGAVVDKMGLCGTGYEQAMASMNKVLMKQAFQRFDVPTSPFHIVTSIESALTAANTMGYPVMVKAVDSSGSRGITKVDHVKDMDIAWKRALMVTRSKEVIIEKWLDGIEFGAQAVIHNNRVDAVFCHNDTVTPPPQSTPVGHSLPIRFSSKIEEKAISVVEKAVAAVGINNVISNVDLMLCDGEPFLLEIGARMGATGLPENISTWSGMNSYEYLISLALGASPQIPRIVEQANAALLIQSPVSGLVSETYIPPEVLSDPDLIQVQLDIKVGDSVNKFVLGPDRIGDLVVIGKDSKAAEIKAETLASMIKISID